MIIGCNKTDDATDTPTPFYDQQAATEIVAEFIDDDIEKLVLNQLFSLFEEFENNGGVIETHIRPNPYTRRLDCAAVSINENQNVLTIDFGLGCQAQNSTLRTGKIIASFSELQNGLSEEITISLEGYKLEDIEVSGLRRIINNTEAEFPYSDFTNQITSGELTFIDGTKYIYASERHVSSNANGINEGKYVFGVSINKTGVTRANESFMAETESIIGYSTVCFNSGIGQATNGSLDLNNDGLIKRIDFEPNDCASRVNVIFPNGETFQMDLSDLMINN
jgi:hypothetical protein